MSGFSLVIAKWIRAARIESSTALCFSEFLEANKKGRGGYCINWAAINLYDVQLMFDEDADMTLSFRFDEGQCDKFDAFMRERIMECIPGDFSVEVISEW